MQLLINFHLVGFGLYIVFKALQSLRARQLETGAVKK
jgi:hypothetical protein